MDKELLLKARVPEGQYEIPGVGVVRFRALTRGEGLSIKDREMGVAEAERKLLSLALIDPKLTEDEVRVWQENSPAGELEPVTHEIMRLSGMVTRAARDAYESFRGGPGE